MWSYDFPQDSARPRTFFSYLHRNKLLRGSLNRLGISRISYFLVLMTPVGLGQSTVPNRGSSVVVVQNIRKTLDAECKTNSDWYNLLIEAKADWQHANSFRTTE